MYMAWPYKAYFGEPLIAEPKLEAVVDIIVSTIIFLIVIVTT